MVLSRVEMDLTRRSTMMALSAPQQIHGAVEAAFGADRGRRLWRLDYIQGRLYLLILSTGKPDLHSIEKQFGAPRQPVPGESKDYEQLLSRIESGTVWRFRLTANPVKSTSKDREVSGRGAVRAHCTVEYQKRWLLDRAEKHGFSLSEDTFTVTESKWYQFRKGGVSKPVSLLAVTYEGLLRVEDAELFKALLTEGIGRGKAYGLGLMTVMRGEVPS